MGSIQTLRTWLVAAVVCAPVLLAPPATAQPAATAPAPASTDPDPDRNSPAYTASVDTKLIVRPDLTAVATNTVRYKILRESAIRTLGQQTLSYVESLSLLEVIEAYTEKRDGRKIAVDQGHILTRDAATGLNAVYQRDAKVKTLIFPDVEVGEGGRRLVEASREPAEPEPLDPGSEGRGHREGDLVAGAHYSLQCLRIDLGVEALDEEGRRQGRALQFL